MPNLSIGRDADMPPKGRVIICHKKGSRSLDVICLKDLRDIV